MPHKKSLMIVAAIGALILSASLQLGYVYASPPIAKITSMNYPRHVLSGTVFLVTVVADYSDKVGVDMGIWDVESGVIVQSISIPLRDTGPMTFAFNLTAPAETTEWHLLAITRIWWQNAWYQDPLEGSSSFKVDVSNAAALTLASSGPPSSIGLDGITYPVNAAGPINLSVTPGVHRLAATQLIPGETGERFVFVGWSDGVASNPRLLVISNTANLTALYRTEYYLSVKSEHGLSAGQGWYPAGSNPSFTVVPASSSLDWLELLVGAYRFAGWSGDIGSSDALASVVMDGPKNVQARWVPSRTATVSLVIFSALMLGSLILLIRAIRRNLRGRAPRLPPHRVQQWARLILVATILILLLIRIPSTHAQLPNQPVRSIVKIGDASWYYWNNTASDTCLIWLGGGTTDEQEIGYYSYMINPFEYESFGTIKFIQHLTTYYCLIALQKGSYEYYSPESNRTIYQEPYRMDSRIIGDVHDWIRKQGYAHTFLVGYSTGAQVAAMEVSIRAPEEWVSPDGLVLITPKLSDLVSKSAYRMKASLLVLYGGSIETPAYVSTGYEFFLDAPKDGWHNSSYLHKNFQVIEEMGHEVWTVYETGVYDTQAEGILVNFVSNVKALQFTDKDLEVITHAAENTSAPVAPGLDLTSATAPTEVSTATIVMVRVVLSNDNHATGTAQVIAFNTQRGEIEGSQVFLARSGPHVLLLAFLPPPNSTKLPLAIIIVTEPGDGWKLLAGPLLTNTKVLDTIKVTVASTVPGTSFAFDGSEFKIPDTGSIYLETKQGPHTVQVEPVTYLTSQTRVVFTGWEDGSTDATRLITLHNDTSILANYRIQYFVNVTSAYGTPSGSGWYDENSTAAASVEPPVANESKVIFAQWRGDVNSSDARILLSANSPKTIQAEWVPFPSYESVGTNIALLLFGSFLFGLTVLWNLSPIHRTRAEDNRQYSEKRRSRPT
ncbi:MAG: hypothetical protein ABSA50_07815 [Candidatus Bathyarchaeia archaeon]